VIASGSGGGPAELAGEPVVLFACGLLSQDGLVDTTETGQERAEGALSAAMLPALRLVYSPGLTQGEAPTRLLPIGTTTLGRESPDGSGIALADRRVSRLHAAITVDDAWRLVLHDAGSKNGTFVNRVPVAHSASVALQFGDVIRVGDSFFVIEKAALGATDSDPLDMVGVSSALAMLRRQILQVARSEVSILVQGESGTGKELVARALHTRSGRTGELVVVNCAAIPETLAESLLFGHVAGAFTGARAQVGLFRAAQDGTLFLDEVGELALPIQAKLLRTLQDGAVLPVGALKPIPCSVRVIAATNRDLERAVAQGTFREDLLARVCGLLLQTTPLRERRADILPLLHSLQGPAGPVVAPALAELLLQYRWPRNVRDLQQVVHHLRLLGPTEELLRRLAEEQSGQQAASGSPQPTGPPDPQRQQLTELMQKHKGVIRQVALELGCSRRQVDRLLASHLIDPSDFRVQR
jgi:transcriptional regulator with PAS, ATPase and Fis domain